jgi:hypothetical protein
MRRPGLGWGYKLESIRDGRGRTLIDRPNSIRGSLTLQVGTHKHIEQFLAFQRGHTISS